MQVELKTKITSKVLFNYMLHHNYTSFAGIFGTVVGILLLVAFFKEPTIGILYLFMGLIVLTFMPIEMWFRAKRQVKKNPSLCEPFHYILSDEGIEVSQGEHSEKLEWSVFYKASNVAGAIVVYITPQRAYIFPKQDVGEKLPMLTEMISTHMDAKKVKIRI